MITQSRRILNALWPKGPFWRPKPQGFYDKLLDGVSENSGVVKDDLSTLCCIRDPLTTPILSDLEKELGQVPVTGATEAQRRSRLKSFDDRTASAANWETMQSQLRGAGFTDIFVSQNDPAVDPRTFIEQSFNMVCGGTLPSGNDAQCGEPEAICANSGGFLVVNGTIASNVPNYLNQCGEADVQCGELVSAGDFSGYIVYDDNDIYEIPADSGYWPLIFFVSGAVTRNPVTNEITTLDNYTIPAERESEFKRIILRYKPMFSWAACVVQFN